MNSFEFHLKKAGDHHGHICAGIALGTKMTLAALKALGMEPGTRHKNLIVYAEIDRCMTDAVQVITGCSLGHRSLKFIDYGKFAATFVDSNSGKGFRASIKDDFDSHRPIDEVIEDITKIPDADLIILQEVISRIPEKDLPGKPNKEARCSICGERIMDGRDINRDGKTFCKGCVNGTYYGIRK